MIENIARYKSDDPTAVIQNWMRNRDVIEFLGLWEKLHNPNFKPLEFEGFRKQAGTKAFTMLFLLVISRAALRCPMRIKYMDDTEDDGYIVHCFE